MLACAYAPQPAFAQRFTAAGPSQSIERTDTADRNAQLSYEALKAGKIEEARNYLDEANAESPFAMFVRAALTQNAVTAADIYKEIVAENEGKPIAREALLQLYRYHYAAGDYAAAHQDFVELQKFALPPPVSDPLGLKDSLQGISPTEAKQAPVSSTASDSAPVKPVTYLVQVGVFTTEANALKFVEELKVHGVNGRVFKKNFDGRGLFGVSAGAFKSKSAADEMAKELKSRSVSCVVVEK